MNSTRPNFSARAPTATILRRAQRFSCCRTERAAIRCTGRPRPGCISRSPKDISRRRNRFSRGRSSARFSTAAKFPTRRISSTRSRDARRDRRRFRQDDPSAAAWRAMLEASGAKVQAIDDVVFARPDPAALERLRNATALEMECKLDDARFAALLDAADRYLARGQPAAALSPFRAQQLGLLPPGWVRNDDGAYSSEGLWLAPWNNDRVSVGVRASYACVQRMVAQFWRRRRRDVLSVSAPARVRAVGQPLPAQIRDGLLRATRSRMPPPAVRASFGHAAALRSSVATPHRPDIDCSAKRKAGRTRSMLTKIRRNVVAGILTFIPIWITLWVISFLVGVLVALGSPLVRACVSWLGIHSPTLAEGFSAPVVSRHDLGRDRPRRTVPARRDCDRRRGTTIARRVRLPDGANSGRSIHLRRRAPTRHQLSDQARQFSARRFDRISVDRNENRRARDEDFQRRRHRRGDRRRLRPDHAESRPPATWNWFRSAGSSCSIGQSTKR